MGNKSFGRAAMLFVAAVFVFGVMMESTAWARAGGGGSSGSRGDRSFSAPSMPSRPSPSPGSPMAPGSQPGLSSPQRPISPSPASPSSGGWFSRSPFMQGLAGGLAGGLLGSLLFGGSGHASPMGGHSGGGIGFLDIIIIGALLYFGWKFFMKKKREESQAGAYYGDAKSYQSERSLSSPQAEPGYGGELRESYPLQDDVAKGLELIRKTDPIFDEEKFKEAVQDMFFRIQASWMNRSLEGVENMLTGEMADFFKKEFSAMKEKGRINRLENIAMRKVEPSEVWQEMGKDYITVLFTANLLDYVVDDKTGGVVEGDKLSPVKFQEFWTFCRDLGAPSWQLAGINQVDQPSTRH